MQKVIHLLPYDGIGGAEEAARSMPPTGRPGLDFQVRFLFDRKVSQRNRLATFNPFSLVARAFGTARSAPDILIVSLWRSCIAGLLVKLLRPRTRLVVLIHNSVDAHFADWLFTRIGIALATAVWADSEASVRLRFKRRPRAPLTIIPFLTRHIAPAAEPTADARAQARFIFWGRLAAQKNLWHALRLFKRIHDAHPEAQFTVIGPDAGELDGLMAWCNTQGLSEAVCFTGAKPMEEIRQLATGHYFYLQTSNYEGMAMSVVEAMQLGLVPVVTPVGEIASYCNDGANAILVRNDDEAISSVEELLANQQRWQALRRSAMQTWSTHPLYGDAVLDACTRLLGPVLEKGA